MKKILLVVIVAIAVGCVPVPQQETMLSSVYIIDTINSIHSAIVAEIDSILYVVPNYKSVNFNNRDSVLHLDNVIQYSDFYDIDSYNYQLNNYNPRTRKLQIINCGIDNDLILKYEYSVNNIKLYSFVFTPENFLLVLKTKKINYIVSYFEDGAISDVIYTDGFVKEYIPTLVPLFNKKDLAKIREIQFADL